MLKKLITITALALPLISTASPVYQIQLPLKGLVVSSDKGVEGIEDFGGYRARPNGSTEASCKDYISAGYFGSTGDGIYRIKPQRGGTVDVWCDMTSDGGGWTRVVRQYKASPVQWTGAVSGGSYTLSAEQIPTHTEIGFGRDDVATEVDYVTAMYTTGDIPVTLVSSPKTGFNYQIHRNKLHFFSGHNPESEPIYAEMEGDWRNTLTIDRVGGRTYSWAYSADQAYETYRGFAYNGALVYSQNNTFAWTIWVR